MAGKFGLSIPLGLVMLLLSGCQGSKEGSEVRTPSATTNAKLSSINLAYDAFCTIKDRPPENIDEFAPYLVSTDFRESHRKMEEEWLRQVKRGEIVIVWRQKGVDKAAKGTEILTAYEQQTAVNGGFVVFADGRVEWMSPTQLERHIRVGHD